MNDIGLLDWQLMNQGGCAMDLSWYFNTTVDADDPSSEGLIEVYYNKLVELRQAKGGDPLPPIEEFKEELAIAHIISFAKTIIGAGGLDKNDRNTVEVMSLLARRGIKAMVAHGTKFFFKSFMHGNLLSQKRASASSTSSSQLATRVTPVAGAVEDF